jgi:predicted transcriptional regulator
MSKTAVITARLDAETLALVDRVSKAHNRSRGWFAARAIAQAAHKEAEFLAFVQEGIDAADRGELVPHDEVTAEIDRMIARHEARCEG